MRFIQGFFIAACYFWGWPSTSYATQVDPFLSRVLPQTPAKVTREVVINLPGKADLSPFSVSAGPADRATRVRAMVSALKSYNTAAAAKLLAYLHSSEAEGVEEIRPIWITNSLRVKAVPKTIETLIQRNDVESVYLELGKAVEELSDVGIPWTGTATWAETWGKTVAWGVTRIGAPAVWAMGGDGQGVVVAMVDSGANTAHPDLVANVWTNPGESGRDSQGNDKASNGIDDDGNGFVDDIHGWNFEDGNGDVTDADGHGTQSAGVVAGDGTSGLQTGVAPRAKLMILRACCQSDHEIFESHAWESMEYAIENGAQVISMSLTAKDETHPTYARWRQTDEVLLVAGIAHVNSAGNKGASRIPRNLGAPATDPPAWFNPRQKAGIPSAMISVGATDASDQVRRYSSFGPATWEDIAGYLDFPYRAGALPGLMKPEVCAPSEVPSLNASGAGYTKSFGGTSSSTPHVAGTVALLLALNSGLSVEQITEALEVSAVAVGDKYNNDCGGGRIDALAAAKYVNAMPVGPAPKVSR